MAKRKQAESDTPSLLKWFRSTPAAMPYDEGDIIMDECEPPVIVRTNSHDWRSPAAEDPSTSYSTAVAPGSACSSTTVTMESPDSRSREDPISD